MGSSEPRLLGPVDIVPHQRGGSTIPALVQKHASAGSLFAVGPGPTRVGGQPVERQMTLRIAPTWTESQCGAAALCRAR